MTDGRLTQIEEDEKKVEGRKNKTRKAFIAFVLDESGSMASGTKATISGMNEQIQQVKKTFRDNDEIVPVVSFVKFNSEVSTIFLDKGLKDLKEISENDYKPEGGTAMYDGVGFMLQHLKKSEGIDDEDSSVLVVIVSDGEENSSRKFNSRTIAEYVKSYQDTKRWTFAYLGANQDLAVVSETTNVYASNTMSFDSSNDMTYATGLRSHAISFNSYLGNVSKGVLSSTNFYDNKDVDNVIVGSSSVTGSIPDKTDEEETKSL